MSANLLADIFNRTETITFDCYGTLIDWYGGLTASFRAIFGSAAEKSMARLVQEYLVLEKECEAEGFRSYAEVLTLVTDRLAKRFDFALPADRAAMLAALLPTWPPFPDTVNALRRLKSRYRLGILSNVDRDLFEGTARLLEVPFDFVVTAQDVHAYKPDPAHFRRMLETHAKGETVLHVAQSLFHDGVPANELGLAYVWINRYKDTNDTSAKPEATFPDLKSLADAAEIDK